MSYTPASFARALRDLTRVPAQIAPRVASEIAAEIDRNFSAGVDPYGKPWAPLRPATLAKGRHPPPLTDTGKGRNSIRVFAQRGSGVAITVGVAYMGIHQTGAPPRLVARRFLPAGVLPKRWAQIWQRALTDATKARLARG